jgi:hypothetical protein
MLRAADSNMPSLPAVIYRGGRAFLRAVDGNMPSLPKM